MFHDQKMPACIGLPFCTGEKLDYSGPHRTPSKPKDLNDASLLHLQGGGRDAGPHNG